MQTSLSVLWVEDSRRCAAGLVLLFTALTLTAPPGSGQVSTATLVLLVEDQAGAVVPGASVTILNTGRGIRSVYTSDETGLITASSLQPGMYEITAEKPGFKGAVLSDIELTVNQRVRLEIALAVGQVTERVTVEGAVPLVNTENAEISSVVDARRIQEFPLNGRNFMELATLTTGITEGVDSNAKNSGIFPKAYGPASGRRSQPGKQLSARWRQ